MAEIIPFTLNIIRESITPLNFDYIKKFSLSISQSYEKLLYITPETKFDMEVNLDKPFTLEL